MTRPTRRLVRQITLGFNGNRVPFLPRLDPLRVLRAHHRQADRAEEDGQRRIGRVHYLEDGRPRRLWIAWHEALSQCVEPCAYALVGWQWRRVLGRRSAPIGRETAWLNHGHLDPRASHLGGERLTECLKSPF